MIGMQVSEEQSVDFCEWYFVLLNALGSPATAIK
jgi:hypothetical protein